MTDLARLPVAARFGLAIALLGLMLAGILVLGRLAGSDVIAMALTSVFFVVLAVGLALIVRRRRELILPLGAVYVLVAAAAAVVLGLPLITDDVVDEDVVVAQASVPAADDTMQPEPAGPQRLAGGEFEDRDHPGEGTATLLETADGTVLTLTEFATDNGPDLFVYLVPADAPEGSIEGFVDLGTLKGNVGDQQYDVPEDVDPDTGWRVVVWCRAFAVTFTEALLG
jgi:hypothetical protein